LKFQGKRAFLKRKQTNCSETNQQLKIGIFTGHHVVSVASPNMDITGENVTTLFIMATNLQWGTGFSNKKV